MQFPRSLIIALCSTPLLAFAQSTANPFKVPTDFSASVGTPVKLQWTPTTSGTVTLILRSNADLASGAGSGTVIKAGIDNKLGTYTWTPDSNIVDGTYTIEIVDDSDPSQNNFFPLFHLDSPTTAATTSMSTVSLGALSSSISLSSISATTTVTSFSSATTSSGPSSTTGSSASTTQSGSMTTSAAPSSSSDSAGFQSSSSTPNGGAPRATAMAGMLGVIALGALAL